MTPITFRLSVATKAATRGTMNRHRLVQMNGGLKRFLTLPPGSLRGCTFRGSSTFGQYLTDHYNNYDAHTCTEASIPPKRRYGTSLDMPEYSGHFSAQPSFEEDYDNWNMNCSGSTSCNLGQIYDVDSATPTGSLFATTLMGHSVCTAFDRSSFFESSEADHYYAHLEEDLALLDGDAMLDDGNDR